MARRRSLGGGLGSRGHRRRCAGGLGWGRRNAGLGVVRFDDRLGDVGRIHRVEHWGLLLSHVENQRVAVLLGVGRKHVIYLRRQALVHLLHLVLEIVGSILAVALQLLLLVVD